ncbi:MAG TPA: DNA starvation/stationary phase protection protein [Steroidobacteraceae bacterium]
MAMTNAKKKELTRRRAVPLETPTDLGSEASAEIAGGMNAILADVFALYLKTKNFHWHMSGPHFRDYHLLLDEHADQIYAMTDPIAERIRKVGGTTLRSIGHIARLQRISDNDAEYVDPLDMLAELRQDNQSLAARLREVHEVVDEVHDIATASLIENWIDETERRTWFLFEASRRGR